jgi:hypothetical protein
MRRAVATDVPRAILRECGHLRDVRGQAVQLVDGRVPTTWRPPPGAARDPGTLRAGLGVALLRPMLSEADGLRTPNTDEVG